jgi:hypothetical protein
VTGFLVYSSGVAFTAVVLSKRPSLRSDGFPEEDPVEPVLVDLGAGSLKFGAGHVPLTFHSWSRNKHRLKIEAWAPFPADGDLDFYVEWPAEGIEYSEFWLGDGDRHSHADPRDARAPWRRPDRHAAEIGRGEVPQ